MTLNMDMRKQVTIETGSHRTFAAPGLGMIGGATMLMLVVLIGSTFGSFQQSAGGRDAAQREIFRSIDSTTPARKVMMVKVCGSRKCGK